MKNINESLKRLWASSKKYALILSKKVWHVIGVVIVIWTVLGIVNDVAPWNTTSKSIKKMFNPNVYEVSVSDENINQQEQNSIVVFANDKNYKDFCPRLVESKGGYNTSNPLNSPQIRILQERNILMKLLTFSKYKTVFKFIPSIIPSDENLGGDGLFIFDKDVTDLDGDGNKEIIVKIMTTTCGSGSDVYNLIFSSVDGKYSLQGTLPETMYFSELGFGNPSDFDEDKVFKKAMEEKWQPKYFFNKKDILNGKKVINIHHANLDTFISYKDLDGDNQKEIILAWPINKEEECHWCPHQWMIGVYKYKNGQFAIDMNFNDMLVLVTKKKYNLYDVMGYRYTPHNLLGVVSQYYGLGFFDRKTEDLEPEYLIRQKSVVWDEVKQHYKQL